MNRYIKYSLVLLIGSLLGFGGYYFYVLGSEGSESIRYIEPNEPYLSFSDLIQDPALKGKNIYVDFWHTGCKPCLIEFQSLPKVKEYVHQQDIDVAFLYIAMNRSVPGERFRWKRMVEDKKLSGYHYFVEKETLRNYWDETVKVDSISPRTPHHLIVNKQGKVIDDNAPGPRSERIYEKLESI